MTKPNNLFEEEEEEEDVTLVEDADTCEVEQCFQLKYKIVDEAAVTLKKDYVMNLCQNGAFTRLAVALSNGCVKLFDISDQFGLSASSADYIAPSEQINGIPNEVNVCGVRFLDENCLLVGTTNGMIRLFDLRTSLVEQACFKQEFETKKPYTCFDCNAIGRVICAGTEQIQYDVHLIFYDVRQQKQLGAYFESHQDDVTSVRFHKQNPDILCTGSTDGLINIFDIKEINEEEALRTTINTESSVQKLNWHKDANAMDVISCITHSNDFKTYECEEGDLIASFEREAITAAAKRTNSANCNVVDAHSAADGGVFLLAGTNFKKGEVLRSLCLRDKLLLPAANFVGNKQIVRESIYHEKSHTIITGGESGIVTLWTPQAELASNSIKLKTKTKPKSNKATPY